MTSLPEAVETLMNHLTHAVQQGQIMASYADADERHAGLGSPVHRDGALMAFDELMSALTAADNSIDGVARCLDPFVEGGGHLWTSACRDLIGRFKGILVQGGHRCARIPSLRDGYFGCLAEVNTRQRFLRLNDYSDLDRWEQKQAEAPSARTARNRATAGRLNQNEILVITSLYKCGCTKPTVRGLPTQERLASRIEAKPDATIKSVLSSLVKGGLLDNLKHRGGRGGYFLTDDGVEVARALSSLS